uniref:TFIIIC_sub6 domain-containing protein n=1 Tax=Panagrellus redivivus TaxID=6233 RepID=A0A7E4ZZM7_PANRE
MSLRRSTRKSAAAAVPEPEPEDEEMPSEPEEEPEPVPSSSTDPAPKRPRGRPRKRPISPPAEASSSAPATGNAGNYDGFVIPPVLPTYAEQEAARLVGMPRPMGQASASYREIQEEILIQHGEESLSDEGEENADDDWLSDDEVEVTHVIVDVNGFVDEGAIIEKVKKGLCKVRHPDTEQPIVQIGGQLFAGKYRESEGSVMIMEQKAEPDATFTLLGITDVVLDARKSYLYAKDDGSELETPELRQKPLTMGTEQRVNKALPTSFRKRGN